ncbi:MAG: alpha-galactosidase, partial [Coriobacteriales bacterium]|nr:alpha-galactosidase [Coriobacteriales bacterium]
MVKDRRSAGGRYHFLGSLDENRGFTLISMDAMANLITIEPELPWGVLAPGESVDLGSWMQYEGASEDEVFTAWFAASDIKARPVPPLLGYSSWYRHYGDIDEAKLESDLAGAMSAFQKLDYMGLPDNARIVFQIDDGWCKIGDWMEPDSKKFPRGMAALAKDIRDAGFIPGLWHSPFVCEADSKLYKEHPDWLLRDSKGNPIKTGPHWSGAYALDVLNPQVAQYAGRVLRSMVENWGFGFVKLDFLYAACMLPRKGMTRGRIMREAMELLREAAGDALLDACGIPLASAFGLADYCRIGCDVGLDWDDKLHMRLLHRERVSSKNALGNVLSRAGLDGRAFGNDPDVIFLRQDVALTQTQKEALIHAAANYGSMLLTSDDMGEWREEEDLSLYLAAVYVLCKRKEAQA